MMEHIKMKSVHEDTDQLTKHFYYDLETDKFVRKERLNAERHTMKITGTLMCVLVDESLKYFLLLIQQRNYTKYRMICAEQEVG